MSDKASRHAHPIQVDSSPPTRDEAEARIRHILHYFGEQEAGSRPRFKIQGLEAVHLVSVDVNTASAVFETTVAPTLCSKMGTLHGAAAAMLLGMLTSACLGMIATPGYLDAGHVSRTMVLQYHRPVREGEKVRITCRIASAGRTLAALVGEITSLDDGGALCVSCMHDKFILVKSATKL